MHPVGGGVVAYHQLARTLDPQQPVYAIENQVAFNPDARLHRTIEEMAAAYVEILVAVRGYGPHLLGGYSMGGLVAFEMARQLLAQGADVRILALIDTPAQLAPPPDTVDDETLSARDLLTMATIIGRRLDRDLGLSEEELEPLAADKRIARVIDALRAHAVVPPEVDVAMFGELVASVKSNDAAQRRYRPGRYDGELDLLRAATSSPAITADAGALYDDPGFGWSDVCSLPVTVATSPGAHLQLLESPYVEGVGAWLQERLDRRLAAARRGPGR
jgi:thioesterase domain-containing protein